MVQRRKALKDMSNVKDLKSKNEAQAGEIEALKAQLADLTSTLEQMSITEKPSTEAPATAPVVASVPVHVPMPHPPKRATSSYLLFLKHVRATRAEDLSGMSTKDSSAKIAEWWKEADAEARAPFVKAHEEDKQRYERELASYRERRVAAERERKALEEYTQEQNVAMALAFYEEHKDGKKPVAAKRVVKKADDEPKKAKSAYILFVAQRRKAIPEASDTKKSFAEVTRQVADEWKALNGSKAKKSKAEVARFQKLAAEDKERYAREKAAYDERKAEEAAAREEEAQQTRSAALAAFAKKEAQEELVKQAAAAQKAVTMQAKEEKKKQRELKKADKEAKAKLPKKPKSAYILFCGEKRAEVAEAHKDASQPEIMRQLGALWKAVGDLEKGRFEKLAAADKERYQKEMAALTK